LSAIRELGQWLRTDRLWPSAALLGVSLVAALATLGGVGMSMSADGPAGLQAATEHAGVAIAIHHGQREVSAKIQALVVAARA